ncbi:hypothetical protein [Aliarcobacter butzleri]|uniref:hypothetical protein n=1 Tax=Aliarcobacter butzleri TaxID=28197 RepID=UPI002B243944|nr:hypothetical protein [Aliarcobacter butzleri]
MSEKRKTMPPVKKYNPDNDIVPMAPNGFGVFSTEKSSDLILEIYSNSPRSNHEVCLGSFSFSIDFAKNLVEKINEALEEKKKG